MDVPRPLRRTPLGLRGFSGTDFRKSRKRLTQRPVLRRATIVEPVIRQLCREIELNSPSIKPKPRCRRPYSVRRTDLVSQIEFTEWTPDGHLRHSKFVGLREDKEAREVVREIES